LEKGGATVNLKWEQEDAVRGLTRFVVGEAPLPELMERIATTAKQVIAPVAEASVTFTRGDDQGWTVASTGELASRLDEAQYVLGHGPCMDAAAGGSMLLIDDLATDDRYPTYGPIAAGVGARSSLSVPFPMQQHVVAA
jgi:GAF domain-containing protein